MKREPFFDRLRKSAASSRLLGYSVVIGAITGVACIGFYLLVEVISHLALEMVANYRPNGATGHPSLFEGEILGDPNPWILFFLPAIGGLLSGYICYRFAPDAAGHGTDHAIDAYHHHSGKIRGRIPLVKAVASAVTIGSGGSAGREGPIAQIGAGLGSSLASKLRLSNGETRTLMAAGMAAGIGATFHAPLAGALFAAEVLYRGMDLEHEVIVPAFISSIISYSIFALFAGWDPIFETPGFFYSNPLQLLAYVALAVVVALGATAFTTFFRWTRHAFGKLEVAMWLKPAIGGLVVGAIGSFLPAALSTGYGILQNAFDETASIGFLALIAGAKILTTGFTVGSGGSGGVFGPSLVIGGSLGGVVGLLADQMLPGLGFDPGAFVLVGMAGFFAAAANCPISTIIMVSELTGNYHLLVPSMLVCILAYLFTRNQTLYEMQLPTRLEAPSKMGNMLGAVLRTIPVRDAIRSDGSELLVVSEAMNLRQIIDLYTSSEQLCFPVVDPDGRLSGMIEGRDIRRALAEEGVAELVVASDLARPHETVDVDASLLEAVQRMTLTGLDDLILVDASDRERPIGILEHQEVLHAYDRTLMKRGQA